LEASRSLAAKKAYGSSVEEAVIRNLGPALHPSTIEYKEIVGQEKSVEGKSPSVQFSEGPLASGESKDVVVLEPCLKHCKLNQEEAMAMEQVKLHSMGIDAASHPFHATPSYSTSPAHNHTRDPKRVVSLELEQPAPSLRSISQHQHQQLNQQQQQRSAYARNTASSASIVSEEPDVPMYLSFSCKERLALSNNNNNHHLNQYQHANNASNNGSHSSRKEYRSDALIRCDLSDDIEQSVLIRSSSKYIAGRSVRHSSYSSPVSQNGHEEQVRDHLDYDDEKHSSPCP